MPIIFKKPLNRSTRPEQAGDNNYSTTSNLLTCEIDIRSPAGTAQGFDYIFLKSAGVASYRVSVDGTDVPALARTVPSTLALPEGGTTTITRHGFQNDLYKLPTAQTGSRVDLTFTGNNVRLNEVSILKEAFNLPIHERINQLVNAHIDVDSILDKTQQGGVSRRKISGESTLRWMTDMNIVFTPDHEDYEVYLDFIEDNPDIFYAQDHPRFPWRCYPAVFMPLHHQCPYLCDVTSAGTSVATRIMENRITAAPIARVNTFETANTRGSMFFQECVHLGRTGAVDDNDFGTFSSDVTQTFNIADGGNATKVTHIFLKTDNVTTLQVQTKVGATWTTQETITPVSKRYKDYDHSITALTTAITDTEVRLVFAGTGAKINEAMLLNLAGRLKAFTDIQPTKVDRAGIVHEGQTGGQTRAKLAGAQRFKWETQFTAVFGHLDPTKAEDFTDWIDQNPNFVFCQEPDDSPWRTYPATFLLGTYEQNFISRIMTEGVSVAFVVGEQ